MFYCSSCPFLLTGKTQASTRHGSFFTSMSAFFSARLVGSLSFSKDHEMKLFVGKMGRSDLENQRK